jgi:hypothetical protein
VLDQMALLVAVGDNRKLLNPHSLFVRKTIISVAAKSGEEISTER